MSGPRFILSPSKSTVISNSLLVSSSSPTIPVPVPSSSTTPLRVKINGVPGGINKEIVKVSDPPIGISFIV